VRLRRIASSLLLLLVTLAGAVAQVPAEKETKAGPPAERVFTQPVTVVQAALRKLAGGTSGTLPAIGGFVELQTHGLDSYRRPHYESVVKVSATPGGSLVRVTAKITAWNNDPAHPGYEVLKSNGRIEADLLDRLQEALSAQAESVPPQSASKQDRPSKQAAPEISAPMPQLPDRFGTPRGPGAPAAVTGDTALDQEAKNLEEILRNQSHPTNLIAVKQDKTPVLQSPVSNATVLFLASIEDEFEVLDLNPEWVHVRISGLSRGWLHRSAVEMLDGSEAISDQSLESPTASLQAPQPKPAPTGAPLFSVSSEEVGSFPGDWPQLKGRTVKIISIQQAAGTGRITSPPDKLAFAEGLFRKNNSALGRSAGLVLIFDSEDGGMIAATSAVLDQWTRGAISEQAFWKQCFLDPPEILGAAK